MDIPGHDIDDETLGAAIIADLRLLMVDRIAILKKRIIEEPHKRSAIPADANSQSRRIDLSHVIEDGMITYEGLGSRPIGRSRGAPAKMEFPDPAVSTGFVHQLLYALPNLGDATSDA